MDDIAKSELTASELMFEKAYNRFREQVNSENDLYHKRLTLLATTQSFLIAAFGLLVRSKYNLDAQEVNEINVITLIIAGMGFLGSLILYKSIGHARSVLHDLRNEWNDIIGTHEAILKNNMIYYPHPNGGKGIHQASKKPIRQKYIPLIFSLFWALSFGLVIYNWST